MNILKEIEAFEVWLEANLLSPTAQLLWYKLALIKKCSAETEWFSISNQELMTKTRILSEHTLIKARNELKKAGLIDFVSGKKGQPTLYKLNSVSDLLQENTAENTVQKIHCKKYTANFAANQDGSNSDTDDISGINTAKNTLQKMQCKKYSVNFAAKKEDKPEPANLADSCSQPTSQNQNPQNEKDINIFDINTLNNNTNTLNNNQDYLEVLEDNKLTNVNTEAAFKSQETTGEDVNNSPPAVNNKELIADLVRRFEEITGKHDKKLYSLLGQLYNQYGYAEVLWALDRLEWGLKNKKVEKPEGYLINVLKNNKKESGSDGKHKKISLKYDELPPDDPYSIIKPIKLGKQPDPNFDPYSIIQPIRLGPNSTA